MNCRTASKKIIAKTIKTELTEDFHKASLSKAIPMLFLKAKTPRMKLKKEATTLDHAAATIPRGINKTKLMTASETTETTVINEVAIIRSCVSKAGPIAAPKVVGSMARQRIVKGHAASLSVGAKRIIIGYARAPRPIIIGNPINDAYRVDARKGPLRLLVPF